MGPNEDTPFLAEHNQGSGSSSERPATRVTDSPVDAPETPIAQTSQPDPAAAAAAAAAATAAATSNSAAAITLPASGGQEQMNTNQEPITTTVDKTGTFHTVADAPTASPATATAQLPGNPVTAPALPQRTPSMSHGSLSSSKSEHGLITHPHQQDQEQSMKEQSEKQVFASQEDSQQQQQLSLHTRGPQTDNTQSITSSHGQEPSVGASENPRLPLSLSHSLQLPQEQESDNQLHTVTSASTVAHATPGASESEPKERQEDTALLDTHLSTAPTMHNQDTPAQHQSDAQSLQPTVNSHEHDQSRSLALASAPVSASAGSDDITREKAVASQEKEEMVNEDARSGTGSAMTPAIGSDIGHGADVLEPTNKAKKNHSKADSCDDNMSTATAQSLTITLLLTNGARHPFEISSRYLKKRNQNVEGLDPFNMSVYTLKELILKEWRSDWEAPPASPTSIRLISFGKMLDDKSPLSECKFNHDAPNVVHMTLRPPSVVEEENDPRNAKGTTQREREADDRTPGCRCVIL
ncbi:hypothetical protein KEM54_001465 [Ascosphaera aggregata]|nr:hypothetical protein KEM54_001465 [Ascosphaera aggregata]